MAMSCWASAMLTVSTRNGMSSLTIWITVCGESQPCSSIVGLKMRIAAWPALRSRTKSRKPRASAAQASGLRSAYSSADMRW